MCVGGHLPVYLELSTCDRVTQDAESMPGLNGLFDKPPRLQQT